MTLVSLTGSNSFALGAELKRLVNKFVAEHTDIALERLDGEEASYDRLRESLESLPFLAQRKMVILRSPGLNQQFAEKAVDLLANLPETTDLIIVEPKPDKRLAYYKAIKKYTDLKEYAELDANGLAKWAVDYTKANSGDLSLVDARFLIDRVGTSQQLLSMELDKLLNYDPKLSRASIELLVEPLPQSTVFELMDAAFSGNTKRALDIYQEQRSLKVEPQAIIAMLAWQLHILAVLKAGEGQTADVISKAANLNPFVVRKSQQLCKGQKLKNIQSLIQELLDLDIKIKTTSINPGEALQLYLIKLNSI